MIFQFRSGDFQLVGTAISSHHNIQCEGKGERNIKGKVYWFNEKYALCDICGEEIMVPGLDDENDREIDNIFRKENE